MELDRGSERTKPCILFLHSSNDDYGASKVLERTVKTVVGAGCRALVVLPNDGPLTIRLRSLGATVLVMDIGILRRGSLTPQGIARTSVSLLRTLWRLSRLVRTEDVDVVYSNTTGVISGALIAATSGRQHIWHVHEQFENPRLLVRLLGSMMNLWTDRVVAVSNSVKEHWIVAGRVKKEKIDVLYNGVEPQNSAEAIAIDLQQELHVPRNTLLIGMIGRVHFWKGQEYFLELAAEVLRLQPNARFVMVGDAFPGYEYLYDRIANKMKSLNLEQSVFNLGFRSDVSEILKNLDIFVLPSVKPDPLPTVILEAMSTGLPVVATNHGGAKEMIVDGVTGFLIPWDDAVGAVGIFQTLLFDPRLRKSMGQKGLQLVRERFSLDKYQRAIEQICNVG